jgi:16S rRNA (cytidine1402-2'-O)-methyltransferase
MIVEFRKSKAFSFWKTGGFVRKTRKRSEQQAGRSLNGELAETNKGGSHGALYVVATPIGNLEDITLRALRILKEVELIAAEDTRHTRKLLAHYSIATPLISYYREREVERSREIVDRLLAGQNVALVSDAGTPGISDPGAILVEFARSNSIRVVPVPGPSALTALLSIAGRSFLPFLFLGFLPQQAGQRRKLLSSLASESNALVFFESPHRAGAAIRDCLEILGNRHAVFARELTKIHEEIRQEGLAALCEWLTSRPLLKGEVVMAIEGSPRQAFLAEGDLRALLGRYRDQAGLSLRDAVKRAAAEFGLSRSEVYQEALKVWRE